MIKVLVADDHAIMRDGLKALLSTQADMQVVAEAANGREVVQLALSLQPDVVIMDISMPDLNGVEATRLLRERCPATRVMMLSMHSTSEHVHRALAAGATGYVLKEAAGDELAPAVRAVHAGVRYLSGAIALQLDRRSREISATSPIDTLSARERQVLQLVVEGHSSASIGTLIHLSPKTVETYRARLMVKLDVKDVTGLVKFAVEHGLTTAGITRR